MKKPCTPCRPHFWLILWCAVFGVAIVQGEPMSESEKNPSIAVLGAGCFWCVEGVYEAVPGVLEAVSGFAGGHTTNPTYEQVTGGRTGHAEVIKITFDPEVVSYRQLVDLFWQTHDPTDGSGVWPDFGPMYRSILLPSGEEQMREALASKEAWEKANGKTVATEIKPLETFYPAEKYHQDFVRENPGHPYVRQIALPKMKKAAKAWEEKTARSTNDAKRCSADPGR
jgi:peptide-methionine (S)-S-oxide reductase